jgi:hypothetical protein
MEPAGLHDTIDMRDGLCASLNNFRLTECKGSMAGKVGPLEEVVGNADWRRPWTRPESEPRSLSTLF